MLDISKKDKKINAVSILPRIEISAQYGYNQTESNTSIILDSEKYLSRVSKSSLL